jgi:hypothetical protein
MSGVDDIYKTDSEPLALVAGQFESNSWHRLPEAELKMCRLFRNIGLRLGLRTTSPFAASALHIKSES